MVESIQDFGTIWFHGLRYITRTENIFYVDVK